jgi:hypothetical protein
MPKTTDKRDAAQRAMDFLREKNIRLKRADALELLATLAGAPNWNVLQAAMRSPTGLEHRAGAPEVFVAPTLPSYVPPYEALYSSWGRLAFGWFRLIADEAVRFCEERHAADERQDEPGDVSFWQNLGFDFEALNRENEDLMRWISFSGRKTIPPQKLLEGRDWLSRVQRTGEPVLSAFEADMAEQKSRGIRPVIREERRQLFSKLRSIVRAARRAEDILAQYESYETRIARLRQIEDTMSAVLQEERDEDRLRAACVAVRDQASAALLLKNNIRALTR